MADCTKLGRDMDMWTYLGFEPWEHRGMRGLFRRITMVKDSLMGTIAKYYALDYLIWLHNDRQDIDYVLHEWKPMTDVFTQRFLFVGAPWPRRKAKSYILGFRGFLEIYSYVPGGTYHPKVKDLVPPVDRAWNLPEVGATVQL